jgi:Ca2+-binding EF-hand superfamily protein
MKTYLYRYDFDKDGYVRKEDVRLILSYIPIEKTITNKSLSEGKYTSDGYGK